MDMIVRAVDVGSGNTKFVTAASGADIRCVCFPSIAYPSSDGSPSWPSGDRRKTAFIPSLTVSVSTVHFTQFD